jgi:hypothetical protein
MSILSSQQLWGVRFSIWKREIFIHMESKFDQMFMEFLSHKPHIVKEKWITRRRIGRTGIPYELRC